MKKFNSALDKVGMVLTAVGFVLDAAKKISDLFEKNDQ